MGGSRNPAAAAHSGLVTCAESGCFPRARLKCAELGFFPRRDTGCAECGCFPGRDDGSAEDGYTPNELNYCKCIIGLLLYETGISANSQDAFTTYVYEL